MRNKFDKLVKAGIQLFVYAEIMVKLINQCEV